MPEEEGYVGAPLCLAEFAWLHSSLTLTLVMHCLMKHGDHKEML